MESLKSKMIETREIEAAFDAKLARNWRRGNWSVRGFALAKDLPSAQIPSSNRQEQQDAVHVSTVVAPISYSLGGMPLSRDKTLPEYRTVVVGRTDGSVFLVQLGEDYFTKFAPSAKLVAEKSKKDDDRPQDRDVSVRIDEGWNQQVQDDRGDERKLQPFEILLNFQSSDSSEECHSIAFHDIAEEADNNGYICTAAGDSGVIKLLTLPLDFAGSNAIQSTSLSGAHQARIIAMKTMVVPSAKKDEEQHLLLSASCDGVIAFWELNKEGKLLFSCQCMGSKKELAPLTCADVSNPSLDRSYVFSDASREIPPDMMFFGTSDGYIIGYDIQNALTNGECTEPDISFRAHGLDSGKGEGICAIKCGGDGTIPTSTTGAEVNRPATISSTILLTGGEDGSIKQWWVIF
jgi:WD40 repeat protein